MSRMTFCSCLEFFILMTCQKLFPTLIKLTRTPLKSHQMDCARQKDFRTGVFHVLLMCRVSMMRVSRLLNWSNLWPNCDQLMTTVTKFSTWHTTPIHVTFGRNLRNPHPLPCRDIFHGNAERVGEMDSDNQCQVVSRTRVAFLLCRDRPRRFYPKISKYGSLPSDRFGELVWTVVSWSLAHQKLAKFSERTVSRQLPMTRISCLNLRRNSQGWGSPRITPSWFAATALFERAAFSCHHHPSHHPKHKKRR